MRIPVFHSDLLTNRHFKRIAKELHACWPFPEPLKLMSAQEILARGLGYKDFHDLRLSANHTTQGTSTPTLSEARDGIATSVVDFLQSKGVVNIDNAEINRLMLMLPLNKLKAFGESGEKQTADGVAIAAGETDPIPSDGLGSEVSLENRRPRPFGSISLQNLTLIADAVRREGSLRDQALLGVVMTGIRALELGGLTACDIQRDATGSSLLIRQFKVHERHVQTMLPSATAAILHQYVKKAKLVGSDRLFPSDSNPNRSMSAREVNKVIHAWAVKALTNIEQVTAQTIRQSVLEAKSGASKADDLLSTLSKQFGHEFTGLLNQYLPGIGKKSD
ncbi:MULTISPECIES: tyrosine-type recombinase/integrase [Pseudomonas]|uniref:tyrosine-type recombinase/integrase n=1 Tax=Pseudomonas TaxID=286 RepID=UPI00289FB0EA|nr:MULTISPECIES: tyrosine-type recombinase/integrase [Pseudomonas]